MPIEAKPLFRPDVLSTYLRTFQAPEERARTAHDRLGRWAEMIGSGRIDGFKEREVLPDFLSDIFCGVLGYAGPADSPAYTFSREKHVEVEGEFADAVLGRFGVDKSRFVAAIEGKSSKDPLERPYGGRRLSAVEQAYRYAINLPCDWVIVTNIRQIRLYHKGSDQRTYELFETVKLLQNEAHFKRFIFSLGAERIVPEFGPCHLEQLRQASEHADLEITKAFYQDYADLRQDIFLCLRGANPAIAVNKLVQLTQKLLDRVLFVAFCEDRGLMPPGSLEQAHEHRDPYNPRPIWENFRGLFRAIDQGSDQLRIPAYNGGLFSGDHELDALIVPDEVCRLFRRLGNYDYRQTIDLPDSEMTHGRAGAVDVDLLGHIFEQSITDLERLRGSLEPAGERQAEGLKKLRSRRRREGAFYTPKFIQVHRRSDAWRYSPRETGGPPSSS
jgi:hypothetical protein